MILLDTVYKNTEFIHIQKNGGYSYCGRVQHGTTVESTMKPMCLDCMSFFRNYETYKGFTIKFYPSEKHYRILGNRTMVLASVRACKNVIDTYIKRTT